MDFWHSRALTAKYYGGFRGDCPCGTSAIFLRKKRKFRCQVNPNLRRIKTEKIHYREALPPNITSFEEDFSVGKLKTHVAAIQPIHVLPSKQNFAGLIAVFFFTGVIFDRIWISWRNQSNSGSKPDFWTQVPTSFSLFLKKNLQRKESVEWVNMVVGKLWKVYPAGLENWIIGLLQPVIDDLQKPDYVQRVEIKQFSMGNEPLSVRNVERRTSRGANDLQYQIGVRYTGGARMLLSLSLKFGIIPIIVPISIRNFDIDGELWIKLRLIPSEPWIGAVSWAFVSLPKIKFELSPFRLFNIMAVPVLSMFLTKLLTEDLPQLFVRPKKIVIDFQKGEEAPGPVSVDQGKSQTQEGNKDFLGELSVTLVDARNVPYVSFAKTDPYVVLGLGEQEIRSKRNSQTTVIGPPGKPIWNQDFHLLVSDPTKEKLRVQVRDTFGFADFTVGTGEVELSSLQDTVPSDKLIPLQRGFGPFPKRPSGKILLRLTYKAYVEDEEDDPYKMDPTTDDDESDGSGDPYKMDPTDDRILDDSDEPGTYITGSNEGQEPVMDLLAALLLSQEFNSGVSSSMVPFGHYSHSKKRKIVLWSAMITAVAAMISIKLSGSSFFTS